MFLRQHGHSQEYPHPACDPQTHDAGPARCKTKHGPAASARRRMSVARGTRIAVYSCSLAGQAFSLCLVELRLQLLLLLLALYTVVLVGGGREGISRTTTAKRACRPCLRPPLRLPYRQNRSHAVVRVQK